MKRYNHGIITTNENCIGCNKCISGCPVIGANISVFKNGRNFIEVDEKKCIHCGHCIETCTHNAREYIDDTDAFFFDLKRGEKIAIAVAPAFYILYPQKAKKILGYLRMLGCGKIYDVGFGADIAAWCHLKYFEENKDENGLAPTYISAACPSIVNYAEHCHPQLIEQLVPIQSPLGCLGIYVRKYLGETSKIAFISPCIAKRDEINSSGNFGTINYNVTIKHLMNRLEGVNLDACSAESDLKPVGFGAMFPTPGGFQKYLGYFMTSDNVLLNREKLFHGEERLVKSAFSYLSGAEHPLFADILDCARGCIGGPATYTDDYESTLLNNSEVRKAQASGFFAGDLTVAERNAIMNDYFKNLRSEDFGRSFENKFQQQYSIPDDAYEEIFVSMHKYTDLDRNINCCSCGYSSCHDMVKAIAYGYNRKENCVHYAKEEIYRLYYTDTLTGIPNKMSFIRNTTDLVKANPEADYVICVADIDNFKVVNDMYGFDVGDDVLRFFAERAKAFVSDIGSNCAACARTDTDRFALSFPNTEANMARLMSVKSYSCSHLGVDTQLTISFGIYFMKSKEQNVNRALDYAFIAQLSNKDKSANTYTFYNETLRTEILNEADITSHMHEALETGEFNVYLQPQFNHATGELTGAETLCRWIKRDGKLVYPGEFIPLFEKNGFIRELDRYMWEQAFKLLRNWEDEGLSLVPISTNISRISLLDPELPNVFAELQKKYKTEPHLLHLEITESAYMNNQEQIIKTVCSLQKQGFIIAMDDFGSGYSSLNTLKDVPFDILKLDMGFLRGSNNTGRGGNILSSIMRMAQNLHLPTIAEGVETVEQADYLKSIGCDIIQGYLYAKPMPSEEYHKLIVGTKMANGIVREKTANLLDISHFLDQTFAESVMFEHYAGPAAILEYFGGKVSVIRINDKYLDAIGMNKERFEQTREHFSDNLVPESKKCFFDAINRAIETKDEAICITQRIVHDKTEPVWIRSHIWCITDNGDRQALYALADNISSEKNSEVKLSIANHRMKTILDNAPSGICLFKYDFEDGKKKLIPLSINKGFSDIIGVDHETIIKYNFDDYAALVHPDDLKQFIDTLDSAVSSDNDARVVYRGLNKKKNTYSWIKLQASYMRESDGTLLGYLNFTNYNSEKETELIYRQQYSLREIMNKNAMCSFHFNLTENICDDGCTEHYSYMLQLQEGGTVDSFFESVSKNNPDSEIKTRYMKIFNRENLLKEFSEGHSHLEIDHRYRVAEHDIKWITTVIDMAKNPVTGEVEAFIYAVDIDKRKITEMIIDHVVNSEFDYLAFIDLENDRFVSYSNKGSLSILPPTEGSGFENAAKEYTGASVVEADRERVIACLSVANVLKELEKAETYTIQCRARQKDGTAAEKYLRFSYLDREARHLILTQRDVTNE